MPDTLFRRPPSSRRASFGGAQDSGWIPFEMVAGHIALRVKVGGRDTLALLDNGANISLIDPTYAAALGLKLGAPMSATGNSGSQEGRFVPGVTVQAGGLTLSGLTALSLDTSFLTRVAGQPLVFFLGSRRSTSWPSTSTIRAIAWPSATPRPGERRTMRCRCRWCATAGHA